LLAGEFASPVYHDGKLYGLTSRALICLDAKKDGEELWRVGVDGKFDGSPVLAGGKLYAVTRKGRTYVFDLADKGKILARNEIEDTIQATPAIANGCIYLRSDKHLYCVGPRKK
jgi:outer membrane protein assembly factor BamB